MQVNDTDCKDKQTVQLKIGEALNISYALASVLKDNGSIIEPHFIKPAKQDCTINISLVDGNGNVTDISYVECGKLPVPV